MTLHYRTTEKERTDADMAIDALTSLAPRHLLQVVEAHITGRPDIPAADLEAMTDRLRRRAWAVERGEI